MARCWLCLRQGIGLRNLLIVWCLSVVVVVTTSARVQGFLVSDAAVNGAPKSKQEDASTNYHHRHLSHRLLCLLGRGEFVVGDEGSQR